MIIIVHTMLDQSFTAHNFEVIYCLESRKGNIDVRTMPQKYQTTLVKLKELKTDVHSISQQKGHLSEEKLLDLNAKMEELKKLREKLKLELHEYLESIEAQVNSSGFKFSLSKFVTADGKEVFSINHDSHAHVFAMKQLQYNIRHTFKVKQSNRHSILATIKTFLNSSIPVYVIRTDMSGFYESIPQEKLKSMIFSNTLLSNKSKSFINGILCEYEKTKDCDIVPATQGVPRGIGISSYLSEMYMRDIDANISTRKEVMFYARYVDDIFIILNSLPIACSLEKYYADLTAYFRSYGLTLKQPDDGSGKCRLIDLAQANHTEPPMDYLGYCIYMKRTGKKLTTKLGMSMSKRSRYHEKIDHAIAHFETLSKCNVQQAYHDLFDSINMITGNYKLFKSKNGVKVGLYYNNDLIDNIEEFDELTQRLRQHAIEPYAGLRDRDNLKRKISKRISQIDFKQRWQERKMFKFTMQRMQELEEWL